MPSPEPIAAEFSLPPPSELKNATPLLALDAIRDPGNLGTLIRTALALGWQGVFFLPGCADPFSDKVLRASRGALFRLPWREGSWEELAHLKKEEGLHAYSADVEGELVNKVTREKKMVLVLSNESQGITAQAKEFGQRVTIPMKGRMNRSM